MSSAPPQASIVWNRTSISEWRLLLARIPRSNIVQTWAYAKTVRDIRQQMTRFGVIEIDGEVRGLVQIQEVSLFGLFHTVVLDRGPLWLTDPAPKSWMDAFLIAFEKNFPRSLFRVRRLMPELADSEEANRQLASAGFRPRTVDDRYHSIWIDLRADVETLRARLKGKWRNALNSAERRSLTVSPTSSTVVLSWLIEAYQKDKKEKGYPGPKPSFVRRLAAEALETQDCLIYRALDGDAIIAAILVMTHGTSATYQIGWTSDAGRKHNAHHLLLWTAFCELKAQGIEWFDVGGINEDTAKGVTQFKRGLGGIEYRLVGLYK